MIGFTNYEVTMTVIIVGPIILALGVFMGYTLRIDMPNLKERPKKKWRLHYSLRVVQYSCLL